MNKIVCNDITVYVAKVALWFHTCELTVGGVAKVSAWRKGQGDLDC